MPLCKPPGADFGGDIISAVAAAAAAAAIVAVDRKVERCGTSIVGLVVVVGGGADIAPVVVDVVHHRSGLFALAARPPRRRPLPADSNTMKWWIHPRYLLLFRGLEHPSSMIPKSVFVLSYDAVHHRSYGEIRWNYEIHSCFCRVGS